MSKKGSQEPFLWLNRVNYRQLDGRYFGSTEPAQVQFRAFVAAAGVSVIVLVSALGLPPRPVPVVTVMTPAATAMDATYLETTVPQPAEARSFGKVCAFVPQNSDTAVLHGEAATIASDTLARTV